VRQAGIGQIATLMLPADVSWGDNSNGPEEAVTVEEPAQVPESRIDEAVALLRSGGNSMIMIGGREVDSSRG
jgi:acetolactate synthase-1/2/3 large subunit